MSAIWARFISIWCSFNHIALGQPVIFLEYIPHLRQHFVNPAVVEGGVYKTPRGSGLVRRFGGA
jgi:hypothetical protein